MKVQLSSTFEEIISTENLLEAWKEFLKGKRHKRDVQEFQFYLMDNIFDLHFDLAHLTYKHGGYQAFNICDPKPRNIHKASVRDRLLHHAIYRKLYPFFDKIFIADSFSCRDDKGTHKAADRFRKFFFQVSSNKTKTCWVLKCDIRKFFASVNHTALLNILREYVPNKNIFWLLKKVIESFETTPGVGLPLGNLTSQLLVNIYLNKLDHFIKHKLKTKYYARYADDFVLLSDDKNELEQKIILIRQFLKEKLYLELHPHKVTIETFASGVDFLGWVHFPNHKILRTATKRRMIKKLERNHDTETIASYFGLMSHGHTYKLQQKINSYLEVQKEN